VAADRIAGQRQDNGLSLDLGSVPPAPLGITASSRRTIIAARVPTTPSRICLASSVAASFFFDEWNLALRDRDKVAETEDQAVFLSAMDGIQVNEGVVFRVHDELQSRPDRPRVQAPRPARRG